MAKEMCCWAKEAHALLDSAPEELHPGHAIRIHITCNVLLEHLRRGNRRRLYKGLRTQLRSLRTLAAKRLPKRLALEAKHG